MPTNDRTYWLVGRDGKRYPDRTKGEFGGHRGSKIYGRLDCRVALRAISRGGYVKHRVFFIDEFTATAVGYRPCAICMPAEHKAWKESFRNDSAN
nr:metal-binding protein [Marinobacter sp.]